MTNSKGLPLSFEESNFCPLVKVPEKIQQSDIRKKSAFCVYRIAFENLFLEATQFLSRQYANF